MTKVVRLSDFRRSRGRFVSFTRSELNLLLSLYSRRVIGGEWKDYAIDHGNGMSAFSIYRDSSDRPLFTVFKFTGANQKKKGRYVVGSGGNTLKRGRTLAEALSVFEKELQLVSS